MREPVLSSYVDLMSEFILMQTGEDIVSIRSKLETYVKNNISIPTISNVVRKKGDIVRQDSNLLKFIQDTNKTEAIISPSGSTYLPPKTKKSIVSYLQTDLKAKRNRAKKAMFQAMKKGLKTLAANENFRQANAKIGANAVSGITKSAGNLFYDVGTYNAITSIARTVVSLSAEIIEQYICGNFSFFSMNEIINHVILCRKNKPSDLDIMKVIEQYDLKIPSVKDVENFIFDCTYPYFYELSENELRSNINNLIVKLTETELIYLFYYNNLKHLIMWNSEVMFPCIDNIFNGPMVGSSGFKPDDIEHYDEDIVTIVSTCNDNLLNKTPIKEAMETNQDLTDRIINIATHYTVNIKKFDDLLNVFVYTNWMPPKLDNIKRKLRNSILLVDTDSNIFTTIPWVKWFTPGGEFTDDRRNYQIHSLIVYFITKNVANILEKYARNLGVEEKDNKKLNMKYEFLYPGLIILDVKKNYTGLITVQEGLTKKEPKLDIKGVILRSSSICETSNAWFKDFLTNTIFRDSLKQQLDARDVINEVVKFENRIRRSLLNGETTFLKHTSIRIEDAYAKAASSAYTYADAWNIIFSASSDNIIMPTKVPLVKVIDITDSYVESFQDNKPDIYKGFLKYKEKYKKYFTSLALHPMAEKIPEEIIPIINMRSIIYHNVAPAYTILRSIGVNMGYKEKGEVLYSDMFEEF